MNIVLDLDDTLYLEQDYVKSGFYTVDHWLQKEYQIYGFFDHAWQMFTNGSDNKIFDKCFEKLNINQNTLPSALKIYREHYPNIELQDDARKFLELAYIHHSLYLITDGRSLSQRNKIHALNISHYFKKIFITGDWGENFYKPHPRAYIETMNFANEPGPEFIYIADNPKKDFITPFSLLWKPSIRIRRNGSIHYNEKSPINCKEISNLMQCFQYI